MNNCVLNGRSRACGYPPFSLTLTENMIQNPIFSAFFEGFMPARQRERLSHKLFRVLQAKNECAMQAVGGGSGGGSETSAPVRAPRTQRRAARNPAKSGDDDGDCDPAPERRHSHIPGERLLRLPQVLSAVGVGKTLLYQLVKDGEFPQPRKIRHLSVWVESEVRDWIGVVAKPKSAS
jgi:predicted DNA-binding transcriptional regulator AlpA